MWEVQAIVLALEHGNSTVCERLDSFGLTILCSIFLHSQECIAQQRGLYLLAVSLPTIYSARVTHNVQEVLHPHNLDSARDIAYKQGKKMAMGQAALTLLMKGFLKTEASNRLRRWVDGSCCFDGL